MRIVDGAGVDTLAVPAHDVPPRSPKRAMSLQFLRLYVVIMIPVAIVMVCSMVVYENFFNQIAFRDQIRHGMQMRYSSVRQELDRSPLDTWLARIDSARKLYPNGLAIAESSAMLSS